MNRILKVLESVLLLLCALFLLLAFNAVYVANLTLLSLLVHELGHAIAYMALCRRAPTLRVSTDGLRMGVGITPSYRAQRLVALGGPLANLASFVVCLTLIPHFDDFMIVFAQIHLLLALSNLLPIKGRDGDIALRCSLLCRGREDLYFTLSPILTLGAQILFTLLALYAVRTWGEGYLPAAVFLCGMLASLSQGVNSQKTRF